MPVTHYLSQQTNLAGHRIPGCSTIGQAARHGQQLLSTWYPPSVTCKNCLGYAVWDPAENERRAAALRAHWDAKDRQTAIRNAARNHAASVVLARHRHEFHAALEAEQALLTLANQRPTVHAIAWPDPPTTPHCPTSIDGHPHGCRCR